MILTVSWGGGFELKGYFAVYVCVADIPIIYACQVTDPWRHKSDLWRHRDDNVSYLSTKRPKYSTEMHQNTSLCRIERGTRWWRFHAATFDSFVEIDSWSWKITEFPKIWPLACHNWVKYWPTTKNNTTNREYSARPICWVFSAKLYDASFGNAKGGGSHPFPCTGEGGKTQKNTDYGRGLSSRVSVGG